MLKLTDKKIEKRRVVALSPRDVWLKWTTHDGLKTFFGRDNKIELRPGGAFEIYFLTDNPPGLRGSEGCKVLSFLPERMLSFSWNAPPQHPEIRNHEHKPWVVVELRPGPGGKAGGGRTEVTITHFGWPEGKEWDAVYDYFDKAWVTVLDALEKSCTGSPD